MQNVVVYVCGEAYARARREMDTGESEGGAIGAVSAHVCTDSFGFFFREETCRCDGIAYVRCVWIDVEVAMEV